MRVYTIDFETEKILPRPQYPPKPVGVAIKAGEYPAEYFGWDHPTGNNAEFDAVRKGLLGIWGAAQKDSDVKLLFHNGKFDVDVAETHFGLPRLPWHCYHDTLFLNFLYNPNEKNLSLKPSAERILGIPPDEQEELRDWLVANVKIDGKRLSTSGKSDMYWAGYICKAPGDLVGKYAIGDVDRTKALFDFLYEYVYERGMGGAYDRELRLMPILLDNERKGVPVDYERLVFDCGKYGEVLTIIDDKLRALLGDIDLNSDAVLAKAMLEKGLLREENLLRTEKTGKLSMNKKSLALGCTDPAWIEILKYRSQLHTCLATFMENWREIASVCGGRIHTSWNQVKNYRDDGSAGARTGRLSSYPNFQNIPQQFSGDLEIIQRTFGIALPPLPKIRSYITPEKGHVIIDRDYSQQELRILGHYEDGKVFEAYKENPWTDFHELTQKTVQEETGVLYDRKHIKITNFLTIYGGGVAKLAAQTGLSLDDARKLKADILNTFPGVRGLFSEMKRMARRGEPLVTWGGREYYCEPSITHDGREVSFDYKMVNTLIQGSAGDCTKEAWVRMAEGAPPWMTIYFTVHDQFTASVPADKLHEGMAWMRQCMESVEFDVPMLSEGKWSPTNWADLRPYDEKGRVVCENSGAVGMGT